MSIAKMSSFGDGSYTYLGIKGYIFLLEWGVGIMLIYQLITFPLRKITSLGLGGWLYFHTSPDIPPH